MESLSKIGISRWRDLAAAHASRIDDALRKAAIELEPKTQTVTIPRRILKTEEDLNAWLGEIRTAIGPRLSHGPVLATA